MGHPPAAPARAGGLASAQLRFMTFFLDDRQYGISLRHVAELSPLRELNKLPHMPRGVEGILELRGRVVPVVNLRLRLALPPRKEPLSGTILVLDLAGTATGLLVDAVAAVLSVAAEALIPASPMLAGVDGAWVEGFIVQGENVVTLLDAAMVASQSGAGRVKGKEVLASLTLEERLDDGLKQLIELAPCKENAEQRAVPQIEEAVAYTEQEMAKVLERVETMLASTDKIFQGLGFLKQEAGLGHLRGREQEVADLEATNQEMQDAVFALIQQMQFQDIARQKLERVLTHLRGLQTAISGKLRP